MERREFLKTGVCAGVGALLAVRARADEQPAAPASKAFPIVISTWQHGVAANRAAWAVLARPDGSPLDAVEQGVMVSEADPLVTSVGYGGLPNAEGVVELDAAIMEGTTLGVGAVAGLQGIQHPTSVARRVMERTPHVLLVGDAARRFALAQGFPEKDLLTAASREAWEKWRAENSPKPAGADDHDTIGMVAMDSRGRMAAACTTSGLAWKLPGRVGDSPIIGAGLYCDDEAGGAAATGMGEEVLRVCGSYQIVEYMRAGIEPGEAIRRVIDRILRRAERAGKAPPWVGFVALRRDGLTGSASTLPGFQAALSRDGRHELLDAPSIATTGKAGGG